MSSFDLFTYEYVPYEVIKICNELGWTVIKIDEVEIRKTGISCGKYNQVVYKGKFNEDVYSYIKDTDYYTVKFKYKDGSKIYSIDYNFFTNVLNHEVL